jgi:glutamate N-acetyltransferase/amino-acid N-acetyltransferase
MSVTSVPGFEAAGIACGIKASGASDLALVATADRRAVSAAGVFTQNLAAAAPVQVSRQHLTDGRAAAVILNSGNANACTATGRVDALLMCELTATELGCAVDDVLVCSTGLIGIPLPMAPFAAGIPDVVRHLGPSAADGTRAATAILTTDTVTKEAFATAELPNGTRFHVGGMAKGAAMLAPAMATMLAVITTDAAAKSDVLRRALQLAVEDTFNALLVDGCTSTNDTVLVLANGAAGQPPIAHDDPAFGALVAALTEVCDGLALGMATDAEGATKLATVVIHGARTLDDARRAARTVARSQLVQCSLYGCDPYWGRVLSELGTSGAYLDPERVDIAYNDIVVCRNGVAYPHDEGVLEAQMQGREIRITCELHQGTDQATVRFTDLTPAYIDENMGTS